jgi:cytochrome c biogenesis protein CcmG/thiol:disulfide interchange protein DsbE
MNEAVPQPDQNSPVQLTHGPVGTNRNWVVIAVIAIVLGLMVWAAAWHARQTMQSRAQLSGSVAGKAAPDFALKDVAGKTVHLSDFKGKAVLLNFWATWCPPCKEEIPWFVDLQQKYGQQGLQVVGIATDDDAKPQEIEAFARNLGVNYPVLLSNDKVEGEYGGIEALPTTFYIGRDGKIVKRVFGLASHAEVEDNIHAAMAQTQASAKMGATN